MEVGSERRHDLVLDKLHGTVEQVKIKDELMQGRQNAADMLQAGDGCTRGAGAHTRNPSW